MKQYVSLKPTKRGFKVWVHADSVTSYFCDFNAYVGRETSGTEVGLGERVVSQLCKDKKATTTMSTVTTFFLLCPSLSHLWNTTCMHVAQFGGIAKGSLMPSSTSSCHREGNTKRCSETSW